MISKESKYRPVQFDWDLYKKIANEIAEHKDTVLRFCADGEPLLHPKIIDMISYAKKNKIKVVGIITNGILLNKNMSKKLLDSKIDLIDISIDAFTKESYEKIRKGASFEKIQGNMDNLINLRNESYPNTKLMVSIIDQPEVTNEIKDFKDFWNNRVDNIITRKYVSCKNLVDKTKVSLNDIERYPCPQLWRRLNITEKGFAAFCINDWRHRTILKDLRNYTLQEVWQSKEYQRLRKLHLEGKFHEIPECSLCIDWKATRWDYSYEVALKKIGKS